MNRVQYALRSASFLVTLRAASLQAQEAVTFDVGIDHIIVRARNLAQGIEAFSRLTGVAPKRGGQHPGRGTENALVSLGQNRYLEILAPIAPTADSVPGKNADSVSLALVGWAIHTHALDNLIARVQTAGFPLVGPTPGSRRTLDNTVLEWRTAAVSGPGLALAPFFIEWGAGTAHPSSTSPAGCRLITLELAQPDTTRLSAMLRAVGYHPTVRTAKAPGMRVVLDCPRGRVSMSS